MEKGEMRLVTITVKRPDGTRKVIEKWLPEDIVIRQMEWNQRLVKGQRAPRIARGYVLSGQGYYFCWPKGIVEVSDPNMVEERGSDRKARYRLANLSKIFESEHDYIDDWMKRRRRLLRVRNGLLS